MPIYSPCFKLALKTGFNPVFIVFKTLLKRTDLKDDYGHDALDKTSTPKLRKLIEIQRIKAILLINLSRKHTRSGIK